MLSVSVQYSHYVHGTSVLCLHIGAWPTHPTHIAICPSCETYEHTHTHTKGTLTLQLLIVVAKWSHRFLSGGKRNWQAGYERP